MAEKRVIELEVTTNEKSLKAQLREAQAEVAALSEKFGATSQAAVEAAKKAAVLKDAIADAKDLTDAFNPDAKFNALSKSVGGVLNGFQAFEGALGLIGVESESLQKTMLRVQSAMAFSQGIQGLMEAKDSFKQLGAVAVNALKGVRGALIATGIGALVVALGTIVAYWDDIKAAVSGVTTEQETLNKEVEKNVLAENEKLEILNSQDNTLKLQGFSEKQILQLKIKQIELIIAATEEQIKQNEITQKAQEEAVLRNYEIAKNVIAAITKIALFPVTAMIAQIDLLVKGANYVSEALGGKKLIDLEPLKEANKFFDKMAEGGAKLLFDPEEVRADGEKVRKETEKQLRELKSTRDGYKLAIKEIDKRAAEEAKNNREKEAQAEIDAQKDFEERMKNENTLRTKSVLEASNYRLEQQKKEAALSKEIDKTRLDAYSQYLAEVKKKDEEEAARKKKNRDFAVEMALSGLNTISSLTELFGKKSEKVARKAFQVNKAAQMASALISTYKSATDAYASQFTPVPDPSSPVRGAIAAGVAIASGLVNVAKIAAQKFEGGSSGGGSAPSAAGGGAVTPNFNVIGSSGVNQLAQIQQQPTRAYVVSGDVANGLSLERNRLQNASF
jgi:hypothetical protein